MAFTTFGDSITTGYPVQTSQVWASIVAASLGKTWNNKAVGSSQAADQAYVASTLALSPSDTYGVFLGVNDTFYYGADPVKRAAWVGYMRALILMCACPTRIPAQSMAKTGSWASFAPSGCLTNNVGSTAGASVSGEAIYAFFRNQNNGSATLGAVSEILVDGSLQASRLGNGAAIGNTYLGRDYAPQAFRVGGLSDGAHSAQIRHASSGNYTLLEGACGSNQAVKPRVIVLNIPMRAVDFAHRQNYNIDLAAMVAELVADGLDIVLVDIASVIGPQHLDADGVHLNVSGQQTVANTVISTITPPSEGTVFECEGGGTLTLTINAAGKVSSFDWKKP